jgi:hypothetical protein
MKKIAIIGRGTAGAFAATHFHRYNNDCEVEWYFDPAIKPQTVGEGSTLVMPRSLSDNIHFTHEDLHNIDGSFKYGIYKNGWGDGRQFTHLFPPPNVAYHFNAVKLQEFILDKLKDKIKITESNVTSENVDADYVMDCSGKPSDYSEFVSAEIPVNAVYVTQCFWDRIEFQHTLTLARPYGWVFGIPLKNRCSIGYMYNHNITSLEEVKEDVKNIFEEFNLTPSDTTNAFTFNNYYRKKNHGNRISYNGNASFFLEPIEATSIETMDLLQRQAYDIWFNNQSHEVMNDRYTQFMDELQDIMLLHYFSGSKFKSKFWDYAQDLGEKRMDTACMKPTFRNIVFESLKDWHNQNNSVGYGTWAAHSFKQNLQNLNIYEKILKKLDKNFSLS